MCCPPTPALAAAVWPGLPDSLRALSPTWEEVEASVILVALNLLLWGVLWALFGDAAGPREQHHRRDDCRWQRDEFCTRGILLLQCRRPST